MPIFDSPEYDRFFNPLCCRNKRIYYECILLLIEKSRQVPLLYETDAKDALTLFFRNLLYAVEDEDNGTDSDESISNSKSEAENAGAVLRYFRHCGWLSEMELGPNGDNLATVMPYCRKFIDAVERIFNRDNSAALTNNIFSIYDILHSAFSADHGRTIRPYSNILVPISDNVADLKNEIITLRDSIRSIMRIVIKLTETNELGQFLIRDEMMQTFFKDYFFIKKDGLIPGYIDEIEKMLRRIPETDVYANMIAEYQKLCNVTEAQAQEAVMVQFSEIRSFIGYDYVREMDYIDQKINNYYSLYSTRIMMVLSGNINMQTYLNNLLIYLKDLDPEDKKEKLTALSESYIQQSYKYIGRRSIERRKKRNPNTRSAIVTESILSDEERARLTHELLHEQPDRYSVDQTREYYDRIFQNTDVFIPNEQTIKTKDDAMMVAAGIIYAGSLEFPYDVEFLEGTIDTPVAVLSNIRIRRKSHA